MKQILLLIPLFLVALKGFSGELPNAPRAQESEIQSQQAIENTSAQNVVLTSDNHFHIARWSLSAYLIHDPNLGWGPSSRIDYRINNRWGLAATEVRSTVSAGFTVRLGSVK